MYPLSSVTVHFLGIILPVLVHSLNNDQPLCLGRSCYPATGNLLVGRADKLNASSTCGVDRPERYCVVGDVTVVKKCFTCDSRLPYKDNPNNHDITNLATTFSKDRLRRWWQAETGKEEAFIQLDLDAEFHFTHLFMKFKTFRPKAMYIERSFDFGKTWRIYRYFAQDCKRSFPDIPTGPIVSLENSTICEEKYSGVLPATGGEVVFKVLPPHLKIEDPYSPEVQDLLKLTNLKVIFKELHTLGDDLLDQRLEINEKYYYAIYDMVVRGSCSCYGHASRCVPSKQEDGGVKYMVHSKCECTHNTKGKNCDQCADFYNDIPWTPARGKETGECKKCECHDHAISCHFDPAVYHSRGNVGGGVCDNCMHNTEGLNCELCKSRFYQDPALDLRDSRICKPCDCDPVGTRNNGECDMRNDPANGLVAGKCKCKDNVGGSRCGKCQTGYWNFNTNGCIECECNTLGTYGNQGCNQFNGDCTCKRFVTGRNCDQCLPGYWGLSKDLEGCSPCGCDIGGSYNNTCDVVSGQCDCKPGITGRACDQAIPKYFVTDLDYLRYEAEFATGSAGTRVVIREVVPRLPITWTGPGFRMVFERESMTFTVDNIPYSMNYNIIIRYETQMPKGWDDVRVTVQRPGSPDASGPCSNQRPQDDFPGATLPSVGRHHVVKPQICFEKGKTYKIKLDFPHYQAPGNTPDASILIDSIALIPVYTEAPVRVEPTPPDHGKIIYCNNLEYDASNFNTIPEQCKRFMFSIGAAIQTGALGCNCDQTGSESSICAQYGGQCQCKPNIVGRRCESCAPGTYGFGPKGCSLCNCNAQGARDNFCDVLDGQCLCPNTIKGRTCNRCQRGMYNFPKCQLCQCNGHADECEDTTGICKDCRDDTKGGKCDSCLDGFYGDPSLGSAIPCRKCMCPGGEGSGFQHADTCLLDPRSKDMKCDCPQQFAGSKCSECAINHYGNPMEVNGTCTSCMEGCNYNIDMSVPGSCDAVDGKCTNCRYNTEGGKCEMCANGFFGDATAHSCVACICNWLGADRDAAEPCNRKTGQCPCLPNVIGPACDQCAPDHWKLASGVGCELCQCDDEGSLSPQCNEFDGQCSCVPGRGGRRCDQCVALHYGDPKTKCFACDCNPDGSKMLQCDPHTGQCPCLEGITGLKCDRCDRGTTGTLPNCVPCGECFDNWDDILKSLRKRTDEMVAKVNATKTEGAVGVYDEQFILMEKKLADIQMIIDNLNQSEVNMATMDDGIDDIRRSLQDAIDAIKSLTDNFQQTNREIAETDNNLSVLRSQIEDLIENAKRQKVNVDGAIQEDIIGAFKIIQANNEASKNALDKAKDTGPLIAESLKVQNDTIDLLENNKEEFDKKNLMNKEEMENSTQEVDAIRSSTLNEINKMVCDLKSPFLPDQFCDQACGGGGCDSCGDGDSCTDGAQGKVASAMTITEKAGEITDNKTNAVKDIKEELTKANGEAITTLNAATESHMGAKKMAADAASASTDMSKILNSIGTLLGEDKTTPERVILVAEKVLALSIPTDLAAIEAIARQINETIQNLTNIEQILNETNADLATSEKLKERADNASKAADRILQQVNDLNKKLSDARLAQNHSSDAIDEATRDIEAARKRLNMIAEIMTKAIKKATELSKLVESLYARGKQLGVVNTSNVRLLNLAKNHAMKSKTYADQVVEHVKNINDTYYGVSEDVMRRYNASLSADTRAELLRKRASNLASSLSSKYISLQTMEGQLAANGQQMTDLQKEIDKLTEQMNVHLANLTRLENYHNKCEATASTL